MFCNSYIKGKTVLDIPCGVGWGASRLKGAGMLYGVDISPEAIDYAKNHYKNIQFEVGNMAQIPFKKDFFDIVICLEGFEHIPKEVGHVFIPESLRVLKVFGLIIMTCPVLDDEGKTTGNPYHIYEYPEKELIDSLNQNYRILLLERIKGPDGPEIRFVGQKIKVL